ncbi:MAG: type II toxin-antitoxin system RelE/ParE family toxin [Elusimicrobia bacterium]|nr:type II toxin-antitoxin system RelE/ParE family toxin [Elusimicrobiota bacterium]
MTLYKILLRQEAEDDLRSLGKGERDHILSIIHRRLSTSPTQYGKSLGGSLTGLRRIRIGDFRVAYQVEGQVVVVWAIKHRKEIYEELEQRYLRKI